MSFLYFLSDWVLFPTLYYVIRYRRKIVADNLQNAFPEKSKNNLTLIEKNYYHYLSDLILETIKGFQLSEKELISRMSWEKAKGVNPFIYSKMLFTFGHFGNYEWLNLSMSVLKKTQLLIPFRKVSNPVINDYLKEKRSQFGSELFPTEATSTMIIRAKKRIYNFAFFLANDQAAPLENAYLTSFLNQPTTFFRGTEKIAEVLELPVFFIKIERIKRGYYTYYFELISENARNETKGFCLEKHTRLLEKQIFENPELWLWSHKRWKYTQGVKK